MGKFTNITRVVAIACLCVHGSYGACYDGFDDEVETMYGQDAILKCTPSSSAPCNVISWENNTQTMAHFVPDTETNHSYIERQGITSVLHISGITLYDVGLYRCWCYGTDREVHGQSPICSVTLTTICQAKVVVNGDKIKFNSRNSSPAVNSILNVTKYDDVKIRCHEDAILETNCSRDSGNTQATGRLTIIAVSSCHVSCTLRKESRTIHTTCTVNISIEVQSLNISNQPTAVTFTTTSSSNKNEPVSSYNALPVLIPLISVVCVLLLIAIALCLYIFSPKRKKKSRSKENSDHLTVYPGHNAEVIPTYAMVDKKTTADVTGGPISIGLGDTTTDGLYTDVDNTKNENFVRQEDSNTIESSISNNFYSKVSKSEDGHTTEKHAAMEQDPLATHELYSEVSTGNEISENDFKIDSGQNTGNGGYEKVINIKKEEEVTVEPNTSSSGGQINDYEAVNTDDPVSNEFAGLYAVVDKTKRNEITKYE